MRVALLLSALAGPALAGPASIPGGAMPEPGQSAISLGKLPCARLQAYDRDAALIDDATIWVEGFLSAQHPDVEDWGRFVETSLDHDQRRRFVYAYCRRYPERKLWQAALGVLDFLESSKGFGPRRL
ncbi:hypothetical protein D9M68_814050 [compost metagenome]